MSLIDKFKPEGWPIKLIASVKNEKYTLVTRTEIDTAQYEVCKPTLTKSKRSFGRIEKINSIHAFEDGMVRITYIQ
jgi:hypothetical protein